MAETNYTPAVLRTTPIAEQARWILAAHAALICSIAHCDFMGIQESLAPEDISTALVLFNDGWGSTLCLEAQFFTLDAVREKLEASSDKWFRAAALRQAGVVGASHGAAARARDNLSTIRMVLGVEEPEDERARR